MTLSGSADARFLHSIVVSGELLVAILGEGETRRRRMMRMETMIRNVVAAEADTS